VWQRRSRRGVSVAIISGKFNKITRMIFLPDATITFLLLPFRTNVFWLPYLALRAGAANRAPLPPPSRPSSSCASRNPAPSHSTRWQSCSWPSRTALPLARRPRRRQTRSRVRACVALPRRRARRVVRSRLGRVCRHTGLARCRRRGPALMDRRPRGPRGCGGSRHPVFGLVWYTLKRARDTRATRL
jgi:hypothetical protein